MQKQQSLFQTYTSNFPAADSGGFISNRKSTILVFCHVKQK